MSCPFYGVSVHPGMNLIRMNLILNVSGNRCGLVTSAHAPCQMEMMGAEVDWEICNRNPEVNGTYNAPERPLSLQQREERQREEQELEDVGVRAIIYLQEFAGVYDPPENARQAWRRMTADEKAKTMAVYATMKDMEGKRRK